MAEDPQWGDTQGPQSAGEDVSLVSNPFLQDDEWASSDTIMGATKGNVRAQGRQSLEAGARMEQGAGMPLVPSTDQGRGIGGSLLWDDEAQGRNTGRFEDSGERDALLGPRYRGRGQESNVDRGHRRGSPSRTKFVSLVRQINKDQQRIKGVSRAIDRCSCCPSWCFTTVCGIHLHPLNFALLALWSFGVVFFLMFMADALHTKWTTLVSRKHMSSGTSVSMHRAHSLDFPAITICNLAKKVPLRLVKCSSYDSGLECPNMRVPCTICNRHDGPANEPRAAGDDSEDQVPQRYSDDNMLRHCLAFNNLIGEQYTTQRKGLADALQIVLSISVNDYPAHAKFSGVHINLHPQCMREEGECPEELSSTMVASPGTPRFYRMTKMRHSYINGTVAEYYDAKDSVSGDFKFEQHFGPRNDTVVLTFFYADMSMMDIKEMPRYTWFSLLAEVGGIMGLLFGVGIINILSALMKSAFMGRSYLNSCFV